MKIKFVHSGDFHLDCPIRSFENSELRRIELLETISQLFNYVSTNEIDILFLAGDLFDNEYVKRDTLNFLINKISENPRTKVYISPGNHDYIGRTSSYTDITWPNNVVIFSDFSYREYNSNINIYGVGFNNRNEKECILPLRVDINPNKVNILLSHGELSRVSNYNPINLENYNEFDYIALGHTHNYFNIDNAYYPGAPYGRSFNETGEHGFIQGTIEYGDIGKNINIEFIKLPGRKYIEILENVDDFDGRQIDNTLIVNDLLDKLESVSKKDIIKIKLIGHISESNLLSVDYIKNQLFQYNNLTIDSSELDTFNISDFKDENTLIGRFINSLDISNLKEQLTNTSNELDSLNSKLSDTQLSLNKENNYKKYFDTQVLNEEKDEDKYKGIDEDSNFDISKKEVNINRLDEEMLDGTISKCSNMSRDEILDYELEKIREKSLKYGIMALLGNRL